MKILTTSQIKKLDRLTIKNEPIPSIDLMERASVAFVDKFTTIFKNTQTPIIILCGPGNNGGDGLAIARLLEDVHYSVRLIILAFGKPSPDHQYMRHLIDKKGNPPIVELKKNEPFPIIEPNSIVIDGIFGSGLSRPISGYWGYFIHAINEQQVTRVAIDIPSGLFADRVSQEPILKADYTISFQLPKQAFFAAENTNHLGQWSLVDIGLSKEVINDFGCSNECIEQKKMAVFLKKRGRCDHKGTFGHALIIAGSYGKVGAAILASKAALKTGCGLMTTHLPKCAYEIMQISFPEAMVDMDKHDSFFTSIDNLDHFSSIGIGPGLGTEIKTQTALKQLLENIDTPLVIDADALNILSLNKEWFQLIPVNSILTPHPKEFERLFGASQNSFEQWALLRDQAQKLRVFIILKGGYTAIACPDGVIYFNTTGNPGMGTAGSGDVLTGIVTSLLAQGYSPKKSALLAVTLHGIAGDIAADKQGQESLIASDIIGALSGAFKRLKSIK